MILSQRRADAIRDVLVNTFKISSKRLQSLGVGEEQFIDQAHPTSAVNLQIQIMHDRENAGPGTCRAGGRDTCCQRIGEEKEVADRFCPPFLSSPGLTRRSIIKQDLIHQAEIPSKD